MPAIVSGSYTNAEIEIEGSVRYDYPEGANLDPASQVHSRILTKISQLAEESYRVMSKRFSVWNETDNTLKVYIPLDDYEKKLKQADPRRPTSIVVPYSYATMETILAYMTRAFLNDSVFQYEGYGPEDTIPAKLLELTVNQQVRRFKADLDIHIGFRDSFASVS